MNEEAIVFGLAYASTPHIGREGCARMAREAVEDWRAFQRAEQAKRDQARGDDNPF